MDKRQELLRHIQQISETMGVEVASQVIKNADVFLTQRNERPIGDYLTP